MPFQMKHSPFTFKLSTEWEELVPTNYFDKYQNVMKSIIPFTALDNAPNIDREAIEKNTDLTLLEYSGSPKPIDFTLDQKSQNYNSLWNFYNGRADINERLKCVEKALENVCTIGERHLPKYLNYQFLPASVDESPHGNAHISFTIKIYQPFFEKASQARDPKLQQELVFPGSYTLQHLANMMKCNVDFCGLEDISDSVAHGNVTFLKDTAKKTYQSSFFFIGSTFYLNKSSMESKELSLELSNWLQQQKVGTFHHKPMDVPLKCLSIQVGRPYIYLHQGLCEHVVIISDIRLCYTKPSPPRVVAIGKLQCQKCMICRDLPAHYLVRNFIKLTLDNAFLCHRCLLSFCYINKRKVGHFQVFKYTDITAVL